MATKTIELRKVVTKLLKEVNKQVYYENATDEATFPYIVYNFDTVNLNNYPRDDIFLTIDVWDQGGTSTTVETLADNIEEALKIDTSEVAIVLSNCFENAFNATNKLEKDRVIDFRFINKKLSL